MILISAIFLHFVDFISKSSTSSNKKWSYIFLVYYKQYIFRSEKQKLTILNNFELEKQKKMRDKNNIEYYYNSRLILFIWNKNNNKNNYIEYINNLIKKMRENQKYL